MFLTPFGCPQVTPTIHDKRCLAWKLDTWVRQLPRLGRMDKADFQEWSKADSTYAASQQTLFIVSGSPSNPILGEVT